MQWIVAGTMLVIWLGGVLLGKGGFWHILMLAAVAIIVVQWAADRRAMQEEKRRVGDI